MRARIGLGAVGVLVGLYGAYRLLAYGWENLLAAAYWLIGGVVVHDGLVGPTLVVLGVAVLALVPERVRGPIVAGLVVLGTVSVTAIPVLGRFGARADNPSLLDRDYTAGWLAFAAVVALATALGVRRVTGQTAADHEDVEREPHDLLREE